MDIYAYPNNCEYADSFGDTYREFVELDGLTKHCGSIFKPWSIVSTSNIMNVRFMSNTTAGLTGFVATWTATNEPPTYPPAGSTGCSGCSFPFTYGNRLFDTCTTIDGDPRPWCFAGPPVDEGVHVIPTSYYYYCSDSDSTCPSDLPQMTTHPDNEAGNCCKYFLCFSYYST